MNETSTKDVFLHHVQNNYVKEVNKDETKIYFDAYDRKIGILGKFNYWKLIKYDTQGNKIYIEDSDGNWEKRKYDQGRIIQFTNSLGTHWVRNREYEMNFVD